ncbi:7967_t:CDS:2, partial [Racocetra persica]
NPYSIFDSADLHLLDELALKCLLESDDLELEEIEIWNCLIKWGISKLLDENIANWSDENIKEWSEDHFNTLKETIINCIPLIRYYYIPKYLIEKQIKRYHLDSNIFIKSKTPPRRLLSRVKIEKKDKAIWNDELCGPCFGKSDLCMRFSHWTSQWEDYEHQITNSSILTAEEYEVLAFGNYRPTQF